MCNILIFDVESKIKIIRKDKPSVCYSKVMSVSCLTGEIKNCGEIYG